MSGPSPTMRGSTPRVGWETELDEIHLARCKALDDQLIVSMRRTAFYRARGGHCYRLALL